MRKPLAALSTAICMLLPLIAIGQAGPESEVTRQLAALKRANEALEHRLDMLAKAIDDVTWFARVGDVAIVDKWRIVGPPDANPRNPEAPGARNPVKFYTYTFVPRDRPAGMKLPMLLLPHGGVHADFTTYHTHIIRELVAQGYVVVAPEYRGSTGYGEDFHDLIDYGGREVDDVQAAKDWAVESFDFVDAKRVGMVGWSHGGLIALLAANSHPTDYACVFAGVPVSDLIARLGYQDEEYRQIFSAPNHIGKTVRQDIPEYKRRSPVWNIDKLQAPLLIHTTTNDEDVNYLEVEHLVQALKAEGKKFEYKVWQDAPGGHSFDRLDIAPARQARRQIWDFLANHLHPPRPEAGL
ncbi:MAG TPA: alpha/beta fold hydrolase [Thermoanaerobaculaceae bacterium]|nr:alpha/beta fold hydrolase [Thermoanaerobaculaceae bacterium]HPS78048.1 alpha/beta fold hydrolase [Thermoanaerobaculaceae bacterium]